MKTSCKNVVNSNAFKLKIAQGSNEFAQKLQGVVSLLIAKINSNANINHTKPIMINNYYLFCLYQA